MTESAMRDRVAAAFDRGELLALCADVQERLAAAGLDIPVDLDTVGGDTEPLQILNLFSYLRRRGQLDVLLTRVEELRPGIFGDKPAAPATAGPVAGVVLPREKPSAPPVADAPPPRVFTPIPADAPMQAFLSSSGTGNDTPLVVSVVLLEQPDDLRRPVRAFIDDLLHDVNLRPLPGVPALARRGFDYAADDEEVRGRFIELITTLSFEAYAYFVRSGAPASAFGDITANLLTDRFTNDRSRPFSVSVDDRMGPRLPEVSAIVSAALTAIRKTDPKGAPGATVAAAAPNEPAISVAGYIATLMRRRIEGPTPAERRAFERLHPRKIRLIHEIGTSVFYSRRKPFT